MDEIFFINFVACLTLKLILEIKELIKTSFYSPLIIEK